MGFFYELKKNKALFLMALPAVALIFIFSYMPMFGIILAFKDFSIRDGILGSAFNHFDNFKFLFSTNEVLLYTRNTIVYNFAFIVLGTFLSIFLAIALSEIRNRFAAKAYQTIIIMPFFLSWVVVGFIVYAYLNPDKGYLNSLLTSFGKDPVMWYSEGKYWPFILVFSHLWKYAGYNSVIYLAAIVGISKEYYEAAVIDGASKWQQIKSITIPSLKPMIIILTLMSLGKIFYADFGLFYQVPRDSGQIYNVTNVIDVYVYNTLKVTGNIGMAAAANLYQSIIGFALVLGSNLLVRKVDKEYALF